MNFRSPCLDCQNSVSNVQISKADAKRQLGLSPLDLVGLYQGSFCRIAGIDVLIEALALHRDRLRSSSSKAARPLKCLFLCNRSEFEEQQRIQQRLDELDLGGLVLGVVQGSEREWLYHTAADLRLIPSLWEPFGTAALSALDGGMPVIASNVDGFQFTIIPEETGLLVPPNDPIALSEAIDRVVSNDMWMQRLKRQTTDAIASNWHRTAAHLSDLYRRLLAHTLSPMVPISHIPRVLTVPSTSVQATAQTRQDLMQVS
jgi:glycosyltransferase involved in cell wall biosynthesis